MYKVKVDGCFEDPEFSTEKAAEEYIGYLRSCTELGAEILHLSNPGDYDADDYEMPDFEIVEI